MNLNLIKQMIVPYPPEWIELFKHMNPDFRQGFEEGFNAARNAIMNRFQEHVDELERLKAYSNVTTTVSTQRKKSKSKKK